jgi:hypothetical protein
MSVRIVDVNAIQIGPTSVGARTYFPNKKEEIKHIHISNAAKPIEMDKEYSLRFNMIDPIVNSPPTQWKLRLAQRIYNY